MNIKKHLYNQLEKVFNALNYDTKTLQVSFSDREDISHLQCNSTFLLAKKLSRPPFEIAEEIKEVASRMLLDYDIFVVAPGFINFKLKNSFLSSLASEMFLDDRLGIEKNEHSKKIVLDYGGPNIAKPLHIGHMRSAIIGESLKRLHRFFGNNVLGDVHLGDWGLQMGLTIAQFMDDYDMGYYFGKGGEKLEITPEILSVVYPKANRRKKVDEEFAQRASDITLLFQQKTAGYHEIGNEMRRVSIEMIKKSYDRLDVSFDIWNGESTVCDIADDVVEIFKEKGLAYISDGALVVDVENENDAKPMPPAILKKHNGTQLYVVTDIATIYDRVAKFSPDSIIYVTDNRQSMHFEQVFRSVKLAGIVDDNTELVHITFGTINGKDGKPFKTRDGSVPSLDDIIDLVEEKAYQKLMENQVEDATDIYKKVGIAALKFGDLVNIISKNYVFDLDKFMTFEGKTGPYLQYTAVRIASLLSKGTRQTNAIEIDDATVKIMLSILKFIDALMLSYNDNSLHYICIALYDLAASYSTFYNDVKILTQEEAAKRNSYLNLSALVLKTLNLGFGIIGIEVPEKM